MDENLELEVKKPNTKQCRACKEEIHIDADVCKHCGANQKIGFIQALKKHEILIASIGVFFAILPFSISVGKDLWIAAFGKPDIEIVAINLESVEYPKNYFLSGDKNSVLDLAINNCERTETVKVKGELIIENKGTKKGFLRTVNFNFSKPNFFNFHEVNTYSENNFTIFKLSKSNPFNEDQFIYDSDRMILLLQLIKYRLLNGLSLDPSYLKSESSTSLYQDITISKIVDIGTNVFPFEAELIISNPELLEIEEFYSLAPNELLSHYPDMHTFFSFRKHKDITIRENFLAGAVNKFKDRNLKITHSVFEKGKYSNTPKEVFYLNNEEQCDCLTNIENNLQAIKANANIENISIITSAPDSFGKESFTASELFDIPFESGFLNVESSLKLINKEINILGCPEDRFF